MSLIITRNICPPIPTSRYDWVAYASGDEKTGPHGYGPTEAAALRELCEYIITALRTVADAMADYKRAGDEEDEGEDDDNDTVEAESPAGAKLRSLST